MISKTIRILSNALGCKPESIHGTDRISADLHMDSVDLFGAATELEDEYDIIINYSKLSDFETVNDLESYIEVQQRA